MPPEERDIRRKTAELVNQWVRPTAISDDRDCRFPQEAFHTIAKEGLVAVAVPQAYGGLGLSSQCYYAVLEELARGSVALSITAGVTNLTEGALINFGTESQKKAFLPRLTRGEWLGAFSLSEPQSGSDAASLTLSAKKTNGGYLLNGTKVWCSNAGIADLYLVMGRTGSERYRGISSFLVPKDTQGFRVGKLEKKLGLRASTLAELIFENAFVPESNRLADEGQGFIVALSQLDSGRIAIGAAGVAVAVEALERAWRFAAQQKLLGNTASEWGKEALTDYFALAQGIRNLISQAARMRDRKEVVTVIASQIKLLASDLAVRTASEAIAFMGPEGAAEEFEVERLLRDAKALQIVEGTNQIQREILKREMDQMMNGR